VAPGLEDLGVLLATTPLHVELLRAAPYTSLVMTSGNSTDEPICRVPEEALARLHGIADAFLVHDREVVRRIDDSVVRTVPGGAVMVRRSRGWVPEPEPLPVATPQPLIALGAHLQVSAWVAVGDQAFCSQHVGDLDTDAARTFLEEVVTGLEQFLEITAPVIVVDQHPDYPSTWLGERLARERGARLVRVQHHLAHAAAVLGEHGRFPSGTETALAVALDGTGLGSDGAPWGGEWLTIDGSLCWSRLASLEPVPLIGGELAVREPWRVAVAALVSVGDEGLVERTPLADDVDPATFAQVLKLARSPERWTAASGAGRLLEAAAALLGLCPVNRWEGEAAVRLESAAAAVGDTVCPWPEVELGASLPGPALLTAAARRLRNGEAAPQVAARFQTTLADLIVRLTIRTAEPLGVSSVAFGGGCLVNRILRREIARGLESHGYQALLPWRIPPGDGGLAYGQAVLTAAALARGAEPTEKRPSRNQR
jgi:hydrogenase maturation protein HypF